MDKIAEATGERAPLAPDAESVAMHDPRAFWGRVLVDGAGIDNASILCLDGGGTETVVARLRSGPDGYFQFPLPFGTPFLEVEVDDRPRIRLPAELGHGTKGLAHTIEVPAFAEIRLRVADDERIYTDVNIDLSYDFKNPWYSRLRVSPASPREVDPIPEESGWLRIERVLPLVDTEMIVEVIGREVVYPLRRLEPGELRTIRLPVPGPLSVSGTLLDDEGLALPDVDVHLIPWSRSEGRYYVSYRSGHKPCRTGSEGRFLFSWLDAGEWLIAPRPDDLVPLGLAFSLEHDDLDLDVHLPSGAKQRGRVLDPDGEPTDDFWLEIESEPRGEFPTGDYENPESEGGAFEIGPLLVETHRIRAAGRRRSGDAARISEWIEFVPGAREITLQMQNAASFRLVATFDGEPISEGYLELKLTARSQTFRARGSSLGISGLSPGTRDLGIASHTLSAFRILKNLELAREELDLGRVDLEPAAHLVLLAENPDEEYLVEVEGFWVTFIEANEPTPVCPGRVRVFRASAADWTPEGDLEGIGESHAPLAELTLAPGETRELQLP